MKITNSKKTSKKSEKLSSDEILFHLFNDYSEYFGENVWPRENERWYELVFCILTVIGEPRIMAAQVRNLVDHLASRGLLELDDLANLTQSKVKTAQHATIYSFLRKAGFSVEKSRLALRAVCEAAASIQSKYAGKIQRYFRHYGNYMLNKMKKDFVFSEFDDALKALAIWLQNTLNMPVPISDPLVEAACKKIGIKYDEIIKAADRLDINVALVDDALRLYWANMLKK